MRTRAHGPRAALALAAGIVLAGAVSRGAPLAPLTPEPAAATRWSSSASVAGVALAGETTLVAAQGALLTVDGGGRVTGRLWAPEAEWRAVTGDAAAGLRHWALRTESGWEVRPLPPGVEGHAVAATPEGVWVGHSGGATRFARDGQPLQEVSGCGPVRAVVPGRTGVWLLGERQWVRVAAPGEERLAPPPGLASPWKACAWREELAVAGAGPDGHPRVLFRRRHRWVPLPSPEPAALGTIALAVDGETLYAAVPGAGLRAWDGRAWRPVPLPPEADDVSSVSVQGEALAVGTWSHGAWRRRGDRWERLRGAADAEELPAVNVQALAEWGGQLWMSTFDRGLWSREAGRWRRWGPEEGLSSASPRALAALPDRLLVRHASGEVDAWDGRQWTRDVLKWKVPRAWAASLSPEGRAGGWGAVTSPGSGSVAWTQEILPEPLRQDPVTGAAALDGRLYVGTAHHGLWRVADGAAQPLPGLTDPWITAVSAGDGRLLAGTFSGEVALWTRGATAQRAGMGEWGNGGMGAVTPIPPFSHSPIRTLSSPVTAVALPPGKPPLAACRSGLWALVGTEWQAVRAPVLEGLEPQCLSPGRNGLWIGGRNGVAFLPWKHLVSGTDPADGNNALDASDRFR